MYSAHLGRLPRRFIVTLPARRFGLLAGRLLLEVFFALLPTDLSVFLDALVRSRGAYLVALAQVVGGALMLARAIPSVLNSNLIKVS